MTKAPIHGWLTDVLSDDVAILPGDLNGEARANCWSFSLTSQEAAELNSEDLEVFIRTVVAARKQSLSKRGLQQEAMTFYCWFDEQASQLRFSMASVPPELLPFGCQIRVVLELALVTNQFLKSPYHDGIPWKQLKPVHVPLDKREAPGLDVWVERIP